ncbi:hypothetical protein S83_069535, partial [Arachis hypogaea]
EDAKKVKWLIMLDELEECDGKACSGVVLGAVARKGGKGDSSVGIVRAAEACAVKGTIERGINLGPDLRLGLAACDVNGI